MNIDSLMANPFFILLLIWDLVWKGLGLWKAAKNNSKYWFVAMLVINSAGLIPIIYLYFFQKKK